MEKTENYKIIAARLRCVDTGSEVENDIVHELLECVENCLSADTRREYLDAMEGLRFNVSCLGGLCLTCLIQKGVVKVEDML